MYQVVRRFRVRGFAFALALLLTALIGNGRIASANGAGAVYVLTNAVAANAVAVFERGNDGMLAATGTVPTGGLGTGSGLGSQGAVVLTGNGQWLFAVNAGSNDISAFRVRPGGLELVSRVASGGERPISLTVSGRVLYVLNAGGTGNISGFAFGPMGALQPLAGSTRPLSSATADPAQVEFSPNGRVLAVTEKGTNRISTYTVGGNGLTTGPTSYASSGMTPFGFAFDKYGHLLVSEAFGGMPNQSALSSYNVSNGGNVGVVSAFVGTTQTAACWTVLSKDGKYAYTANTGSGSVTGYRLGRDGSLTLLNADGRTGVTGEGSRPADAAISHNGQYLYVRNGGNGTISIFGMQSDGSLSAVGSVAGLPMGAAGLAVR